MVVVTIKMGLVIAKMVVVTILIALVISNKSYFRDNTYRFDGNKLYFQNNIWECLECCLWGGSEVVGEFFQCFSFLLCYYLPNLVHKNLANAKFNQNNI